MSARSCRKGSNYQPGPEKQSDFQVERVASMRTGKQGALKGFVRMGCSEQLIRPFNKPLFSAYYVPGTVKGTSSEQCTNFSMYKL